MKSITDTPHLQPMGDRLAEVDGHHRPREVAAVVVRVGRAEDEERELEGPEQPDLWVWGLTVRFFAKMMSNFRQNLLVFGCIETKFCK